MFESDKEKWLISFFHKNSLAIDKEAVLELTRSDKKMKDGQIRFVLLKKIGKAFVDATVTDEEILAALNEINFTEEDARE